MAGLTATSTFLARPASTVRLLALSVTVCTLLDPLLVHAAGWWLSVGATAGIALLGRPLAARLPGPRALAESLAVTASAQVGVAPASLALFGGMPVVSVLANLLAVPAAAPVMVWGLPAGLVAGLVPHPVASALHLPSLICIRWIVLVANVGSRLRLGTLSLVPMLLATLAVTVAVMARRHLPRALALAALVLVLVGAAVHAPSPQAASPAWPAGGRSPVQPAGSRTAAGWSRSAAVALGPGVESLGRVVRDALHPP
jgi:competence protein ComEC